MKKNYMIICDNEDQSELVQIKILGAGYTWAEGGRLIAHKNKPVLLFQTYGRDTRTISYLSELIHLDQNESGYYKDYIYIPALSFLKLEKI